jgi:predicted N-acetyltransferase YhbS
VEIRPLGPHDDIEAELDLRRRAFGPISPARRSAWVTSVQGSIDAGAIIGAFDGGHLVGSARYHLMRQWWHGRSMPMAGVAGVKVAPEERGRGVGKAMMTFVLAEIARRGMPVSVLFPATVPLYRAYGWEIAGGVHETVLPARSLTALADRDHAVGVAADASPKLRRATPADGAAIVRVKGLVHERLLHCGPNTREPWIVRDWLDDEDHFAYLADDGFLSYRWADRGDRHELEVEELVAASAATAGALWQILASHTNASRVRAVLAPDDPVTWLTREPLGETRQVDTWMLRVVDAPAAIAARGYPDAAMSVRLDLADAAQPANAGRWLLEVCGGAASLNRLGDAPAAPGPDALSLGARGFAAVFAGVPLATLRLAGLAAGGDPASDDALGAAFRGPAFMIDHF